ncbi:MAG: class I SAM-dependent methyltransferase [Alphaproteobacteria bacterium]|nr:class I SAM-dependent methyltransferase [Alphaproteobacteria bacterium]
MNQLDPELADTPEAATHAARFGVPPAIHSGDFIYEHLLRTHRPLSEQQNRELVIDFYFADGDRSARRLDEVVRRFHPHAGARRLSLLEFASGYGCVSRHLGRMTDRYDLLACDIHPQAIDFLERRLDVRALLSRSDPADFKPGRQFDVVFALSFFSHIPDRNWGRWVAALFDCVAENGLLIFTAHGRIAHEDVNQPQLDAAGYWFLALSEQRDLPTDEYGTMIVTPAYAAGRIEACSHAALLFFQEGFWWEKQDTYVIRRVPNEFRQRTSASATPDAAAMARLQAENYWLNAENIRLMADDRTHREAVTGMRASTSWRVTAPLRALGRLLGR